jgi:hypothetical protein
MSIVLENLSSSFKMSTGITTGIRRSINSMHHVPAVWQPQQNAGTATTEAGLQLID